MSESPDVKGLSSQVLAAWVVSYRLLGINQELAVKCMEELAARREAGDVFNYEEYIEDKIKEISPKNSINLDQISKAIKSIRG